MGLPGCLFVCHLILLLVCFLFNCVCGCGIGVQIWACVDMSACLYV